jgi:hypothetical protein
MKKYIISKETENKIKNNDKIKNEDNNDDINALSNNKVDVEIEPDVKSNKVNLQMCYCPIVFNCFTTHEPNKLL